MTLPLEGLRVLDLTSGAAQSCGRYLADLGADVALVEPPGGSAERNDPIGFGLRNANKRGITLDPSALMGEVDIVLQSSVAAEFESLLEAHPSLVVVSITDFGRTGPYRDLVVTEAGLAAWGGVLSRSGLPGKAPLLPPPGLVGNVAGVHATWAALVAYAKRLRTGEGELVDVSAFEAVVHGFDPGFGTQGSAAAGRKESFPRGRPDAADYYPVFPCADGHVRICLLAPRQWRGMFDWLGQPEEFADPRYDHIAVRFDASDRLHPLIAQHFADKPRADLVAEGTRRGIPIAAVLSAAEVLEADHFAATGALVDAEILDGVTARVPHGYVSVDGVRAGIRQRAPRVGEHDADPFPPRAADNPAPLDLSGLRVLDLGVIVFGAELGRLFADQGADVIKIEHSAFPDGLRQTRKNSRMNASFAWGARNKRSLGLDLRSAEGQALMRDLVRTADVVAANFKPGTLSSLGLSYTQLKEINPRIVVSDSSAFGSRGPWSDRMGYGPLVRGACGVSTLWEYCDGATVYPDHVAGHVGAVAVLAGLIGRARTGRGMGLELAQSDVALMHLGPVLAGAKPVPAAAVHPSDGDDEWCVIDRTAGVPAAPMVRLPDLLTDPQLVSRQSFRTMEHGELPAPIPTGARVAVFSSIPDPPLRPAPLPGEHTVEICAEVLGMEPETLEVLVKNGVLEVPPGL